MLNYDENDDDAHRCKHVIVPSSQRKCKPILFTFTIVSSLKIKIKYCYCAHEALLRLYFIPSTDDELDFIYLFNAVFHSSDCTLDGPLKAD